MSIANPIVKLSQMPRPISWSHEIDQRPGMWWSTAWTGKPANDKKAARMQKMFILRDKLLSFGGDQVCMPIVEDDYTAIMSRGQFFYGEHARLKVGLPSQCHYNSSLLWEANKGNCQIATGYALSPDGIWRQHTWVVQPLTLSWRIWETTVKRVAYFGVVFNDDECAEFADMNG